MTVTLRIAETPVGIMDMASPTFHTSDPYTLESVRSIELVAVRGLVLSHAGPVTVHDVDITCFGNSPVRHRNVVSMEVSL